MIVSHGLACVERICGYTTVCFFVGKHSMNCVAGYAMILFS